MFYFLIRKITILAKPFSDFFGYHVIRSDLNNLLNVKKKHRGINIFIKFFFIDILFKIMSTINSKSDISLKLKELKDSNKIEKTEYFESITDKERYDNNWKTFINSIPFNSNGIQHGGSKKKGITKNILDFLFDGYVKKETQINEILEQSNIYNAKEDDIINLLDRKFLVSKIIWLITIIIITQSIYMMLIIRN